MFRSALISMFVTTAAIAHTWAVEDDGKAGYHNIQEAAGAVSDKKTARMSYQYLLTTLLSDASRLEIGNDVIGQVRRGNSQDILPVPVAENRISEAFELYKRITSQEGLHFDEVAPVELKLANRLLNRRAQPTFKYSFQVGVDGFCNWIGAERVCHNISPDRRYLVSTNASKTRFVVYDLFREREVFEQETGGVLEFSADSSSIFYVPSQRHQPRGVVASINRFDIKNSKLLQRGTGYGYPSGVHSIACNPDGKTFAASYGNALIEIREIDSGETVALIEGEGNSITSLSYNHDGTLLAAGDVGGSLRIWRWRSNEEIYTYTDSSGSELLSMDFHPLRDEIAFSFGDGSTPDEATRGLLRGTGPNGIIEESKIRIRNLSASNYGLNYTPGEEFEIIGNVGFTHSLKYSPTGLFLACSGYDNKTKIFHTANYLRCLTVGSELEPPPTGQGGVYWHRVIGDHIFWIDDFVLSGAFGNWWDLSCQKVLSSDDSSYCSNTNFGRIKFSPDESRVAATTTKTDVLFWSTQTGDYLGKIKTPLKHYDFGSYVMKRSVASATCGLSFSPDGKQIAVGSPEHFIYVFDSTVGNLLFICKPPEPEKLFRNGEWVDAVSPVIEVDRNYNPPRKYQRVSDGGYGMVSKIIYSPSGDLIASDNGRCWRVWDAKSGKQLSSFSRNTVSFDSSLKYLSCYRPVIPPRSLKLVDQSPTKGFVEVWDTTTSTLLNTFETDYDNVSFSHDDQSLIMWPDEHLLRGDTQHYIIWDFKTNIAITSDELKEDFGDTSYYSKFLTAPRNTKDRLIANRGMDIAFYDKADISDANDRGEINSESWDLIVTYPQEGMLVISPSEKWLVNDISVNLTNSTHPPKKYMMMLTDLNPVNQRVNNKIIASEAKEMIENSNGDPLLLRKSLDEMSKKITNEELAALSNLIFQILHEEAR